MALALAVVTALPALSADSPPVKREFRAVWVATVGNIDWPSKKGLSADEQKKEMVALLDRFKELNFNAVVLQVRPMCDALYDSKLEPWSEYLTGEQGKSPGYDPLTFAVEEAHKRGLELHAWFNPYRAAGPTSKSEPAANHLTKTRPDLAKEYGKHHWLNPTHPVVQKHSLAVMLDVVMRYDIDGVHMDDYFYPYAEKDAAGAEIPFPDDDTWDLYQQAAGKLSRDDWRRDAVNRFVRQLYADVKAAKPWVKVGISPFGIWRPGNPEGIEGFDQYAKLYADARLWLRQGWVDYFTPQLYWPINQEKQSYPKLLEWWSGQNVKHRHLWPGNAPYRVAGKGWPVKEVADQIELTRKLGAGGNVHFSAKPILKDPDGLGTMFAKVYAEPALVPASPWLGGKKPEKPGVVDAGDQAFLPLITLHENTRFVVVRSRTGDAWTTKILVADGSKPLSLSLKERPDEFVVTAVSRNGIESDPAGPK
jgi:uncharacterized lipoprotein YddW (UPF0748 family)